MALDSFFAFMEGYVLDLERMADQEKEQFAALVSYDPKRIDHAVSAQQAANMRLAQLEAQREAQQRQSGLGGLTFQQILQRLEGPDHERFSQLFARFSQAIENIQYYNRRSASFVDEGLRLLGGTDAGAQPGTYDASGKRPEEGRVASLFETEV